MASLNLAKSPKFGRFWTLSRRGPRSFLGVHAAEFGGPRSHFRGPRSLALVTRKFAVDGRGVARRQRRVAVTREITWSTIEPNRVPEFTETARMTQNRPNVHRTWPVDRLDLIAAVLEGLG